MVMLNAGGPMDAAFVECYLEGRESHSDDVAGCFYYPLQGLVVHITGTTIPNRYTIGQCALYGASVKQYEDGEEGLLTSDFSGSEVGEGGG